MVEIRARCCGTVIISGGHCRSTVEKAARDGVSLTYADLPGLDLRGLDLRGADFRGANLRETFLNGSNLKGCDFRGAVLVGTSFREAYVDGAKIDRYILGSLRLINLRGTQGNWDTYGGRVR